MNDVYQVLNQLGISFIEYDHEPFYTCEDAQALKANPLACQCKNLFLRNRKGDKHYLLILPADKQANLKELETVIGEKGISFASPERLGKYLELKPGSVSPFGLINSNSKEVIILLDRSLFAWSKLLFHPNLNTSTLEISTEDFLKFLDSCGNKRIDLEV